MQRCPKCGYRERFDWPTVLWGVGFFVLYLALTFSQDYVPRRYRVWTILIGLFGFLLFNAGTIWRAKRLAHDQVEYLKSHPGPIERVKNHVRPNPANS